MPLRRVPNQVGVALTAIALPLALAYPPISQPSMSEEQLQRNLVFLGYQKRAASFRGSVDTVAALKDFQHDNCLVATGNSNVATRDKLRGQVQAVQTAAGVEPTGVARTLDDAALRRFQVRRGLVGDATFGPEDYAALQLVRVLPCARTPEPPKPDPARQEAAAVAAAKPDEPPACAPGTRDLGLGEGYDQGNPKQIRLCAVTGLKSNGGESLPAYFQVYIDGANGDIVVNAAISGPLAQLFAAAARDGITLKAESGYRSQFHQEILCNQNPGCRSKTNYDFVQRPGYSQHQMGLAVDFSTLPMGETGDGLTCNTRHRHPQSPEWQWLDRNARAFGFRQYAKEAWHWDTMTGKDRC